VHKSGRPAGAPQILEGAIVGSLPDESRLSPEIARHLLKFLLPMEKEAFLLFHPLADIPGSSQNLMNLSTLDYSNYFANTKSVHVEDTIIYGEEIERQVKVEEEHHVKVEYDHCRCEEREGEEEEDEMSEGPFRVNRDEAKRLGYRDEVFIRDYEAGCQRILNGMKRMQRAQ
jgi:hypothetical protein